MANGTSQRIDRILKSLPQLKAICMQLTEIAALDARLQRSLPAEMARRVRLSSIQGNFVYLAVTGSPVAARLRMMTARLLRSLREVEPSLAEIRIVVEMQSRRVPRRSVGIRIGSRAAESLDRLAGALPEGALRQAIEKLLAGQRGSDGEDDAFEDEKGEDQGQHEQAVLEHLPGEAQPTTVPGEERDSHCAADHEQNDEADDAQCDGGHGEVERVATIRRGHVALKSEPEPRRNRTRSTAMQQPVRRTEPGD
jgi:hypothetical protein